MNDYDLAKIQRTIVLNLRFPCILYRIKFCNECWISYLLNYINFLEFYKNSCCNCKLGKSFDWNKAFLVLSLLKFIPSKRSLSSPPSTFLSHTCYFFGSERRRNLIPSILLERTVSDSGKGVRSHNIITLHIEILLPSFSLSYSKTDAAVVNSPANNYWHQQHDTHNTSRICRTPKFNSKIILL